MRGLRGSSSCLLDLKNLENIQNKESETVVKKELQNDNNGVKDTKNKPSTQGIVKKQIKKRTPKTKNHNSNNANKITLTTPKNDSIHHKTLLTKIEKEKNINI